MDHIIKQKGIDVVSIKGSSMKSWSDHIRHLKVCAVQTI